MRINQRLISVLGAALLLPACSQETSDDGYGSASVAALTSSDVDRVEVTIDGTSFAETLSRDPGTGNFEPVVISDIPIGSYTFRAQAYDDTTTPGTPILLYEGTAPATITEGVQTAVTILLQQVPPADPFVNTVPIFQSLVYTPANPRTDEVVTLTVSVLDPDVGDVVTLLWSAPGGGTLTPPLDQPSVDWTAPSTDGTYPVTITASDLSGATSTLTANIGVSLRLGSAEVSIDLNTWPEVSNLVPDPTRIDVNETTSLTLTAADLDGDDLAYAWSATGCAGTFSDATAASPTFTLTDAQGNTECTLSVTVTDVDTVTALPRGGSNTADVTIATGPAILASGLTTLTCPFSTSASTIVNYHVPTALVAAVETIPFDGAVEIDCESSGTQWSCSAAFASVMGPYTLTGLGELCVLPMPPDFCERGAIYCDAGTDQNVTLEQRHNIGSCSDNPDCRASCDAYCGAGGAVRVANSPACEGFCRQSDEPMCLPDYFNPTDYPALNQCPDGDTCDELLDTNGLNFGHDDFCGCQCVSVGDGGPAGAGEALLNIGYEYYILQSGAQYGVDGQACTADDQPEITIPPVCLPYTTSTATVTLPDASYYSAATYPIIPIDGTINPPPRTGLPFTCADGVPSTTSGARLQGVFASKDTARWDEATEVTINCE